MKLTTFLLALLPLTLAAPIEKRALTLRTYDSMSISGGRAGNAQSEALAKFTAGLGFTGLPNTQQALAVSANDLKILKVERENAEKAETEAFNPAIDRASGAAKDALQCGKIKNKVLKLTGLAIVRRIDLAQRTAKGQDVTELRAQLDDTEKKLANNIKTDQASAGKSCTAVRFTGKTRV
ncbi:hypothetical protein BJ508DRAFT_305946 [Ascobolus immersus RN42]|uniref:Small secreted protein n=1 Tax=Ascobolus immersus RN42 TaxID=1160509 RepID=A0A3N4I7J8_ASCIM|nr:hypothetical protein BJ508DRAFT_305946 [Ascobolus immersus RN42]